MSDNDNNNSNFHWPPLESDPEIFEKYMAGLGLPEQWGFSELFGFDEDLLGFVPQPVLAVIVNYERLKKAEDQERGMSDNTQVVVDYYMKQLGTLDNACGVIAALHAIYNNLHLITLEPDKTLAKYLNAVRDKTPVERATILEGFQEFQEQHKAFAAQGQSNLAETQDAIKCHYVAFVINGQGQLVELDGTKKGPHVVGENCQDVLRGSIAVIQKRLEDGEISQSLSVITLNAKS